MKLDGLSKKERQEMLYRFARILSSNEYPFTARVQGDTLVIGWRWKDAEIFQMGAATREVKEYRYVVTLKDDYTFSGYDTDSHTIAKAGVTGHVVFQSSSFVGHEFSFCKEMGIGKNNGKNDAGINKWSFSTKMVHDTIRKLFEKQGLEYEEPSVTWITAKGILKLNLMIIGSIFLCVFAITSLVFILKSVAAMLLFMSIFGMIGLWLLLAGIGVAKIPVFSVKMCLVITFGGIALSFAVVFLVLMCASIL